MKPKLLILLMLTAITYLQAGAFTENYIVKTVYGDEAGSEENAIRQTTYYDGIGRKVYEVQNGYGGNGQDVVTKIDYDGRGNVSKTWLPLPVVNGSINYDYYGSGEIPYKKNVYEEISGLNRLCGMELPGILWKSRDIRYEYLSNDTLGNKSCILLKVEDDGSLTAKGYYRKGTLRVKKHTDTENRIYLEFTDRHDRKIQSRIISGDTISDTRFVYDYRGDLRYTISPEGMALVSPKGSIDKEILKKYGNYYQYDIRHRVIEKHISGAVYEYVYDKLDKLIFRRDALQRKNGEWILTKYDDNLRPVVEGTVKTQLSRAELQNLYGDSLITEQFVKKANIAESQMLYTANSGPSDFTPYRAWYYDNYEFTLDHTFDEIPGFVTKSDLPATTLCTGTAQLCNNTVWFTKTEYDYRRLPIYECTYDLFLNDSRITKCNEYDFRGNVIKTYEKVEDVIEGSVTNSHYAVWSYTLDKADRIKTVSLSVNGGPAKEIQTNEYDEIGRLKSSVSGVKSEYRYDIQSNITRIETPVFVQELYYANNPLNSENVCYDGNVCASIEAYRDEELQVRNEYDYSYDALGRLKSAITTDGEIKEQTEYDLNANVQSLQRYFYGNKVQDAVMSYDGNRMTTVRDVSMPYGKDGIPSFLEGDYTRKYSINGNLYSDETRGITSIIYDKCVNMPKNITFDNGNSITTDYMPDGTLMKRSYNSRALQTTIKVNPATGDTIVRKRYITMSEIHSYRGSFENIGGKWRLHTGVGFYDLASNSNHYYIKDNIGSIVAVVSEDGKIEEQTAYLPSGIPFPLFDRTPVTDRRHIGNIWQSFNGYYTYDNTARSHYPLIPSFDTLDPQAEKYPSLSPYSHCAGNPRNVVDPSGETTYVIRMSDGSMYVIGGSLDSNTAIIECGVDGDGEVISADNIVGQTTSETTFYNSEGNGWAIGSIINPTDQSGKNFLTQIKENTPSLFDYMNNAGNNELYDFKATNGEIEKGNSETPLDIYRGMPVGTNENGETIYSSARDIGNMAAGYVAAKNGISWGEARIAFDAYEVYTRGSLGKECQSSQNAQFYGWKQGVQENKEKYITIRLIKSIILPLIP